MALAGPGCTHHDDAPKSTARPYGLDTCAVCGMKLSGMGKPVALDYYDHEIKVCDQDEAAEFRKNSGKYYEKYIMAMEVKNNAEMEAKDKAKKPK